MHWIRQLVTLYLCITYVSIRFHLPLLGIDLRWTPQLSLSILDWTWLIQDSVTLALLRKFSNTKARTKDHRVTSPALGSALRNLSDNSSVETKIENDVVFSFFKEISSSTNLILHKTCKMNFYQNRKITRIYLIQDNAESCSRFELVVKFVKKNYSINCALFNAS